jgi:hypothetical protein
MSVVYVHSGMAGAPQLSRNPGTLVTVFNWALPQLGWTIADGDANQGAYRNADGDVIAIFDNSSLVESVSTSHSEARIAGYRGFVNFSNRGIITPGSRYVHKTPMPTHYGLLEGGYHFYGDSLSVFLIIWAYDGNVQPILTTLGRPRWYGTYFGKFANTSPNNPIIFGHTGYNYIGSTVLSLGSGFGLYSANTHGLPSLIGSFEGHDIPVAQGYASVFDLAPEQSSVTLLSKTGLSPRRWQTVPQITRIWMSQVNPFAEPWLYPRGLYAGVGDWGGFIETYDNQDMPSIAVDVGMRTLKPLALSIGYSTTTHAIQSGDYVFLDVEGPW